MTIQTIQNLIEQAQHASGGVTHVTEHYTILPTDTVIITTPEAATTLTLPSVSGCAGKFLSVYELNGTHDVTITAHDSSDYDAPTWADIVLTAAEDRVLLYCDGYRWWSLVDVST